MPDDYNNRLGRLMWTAAIAALFLWLLIALLTRGHLFA